MNSVQENKNELEAAVRYCESAISRAKQTIESMEFRQEMAKKQSSEAADLKLKNEELKTNMAMMTDEIDDLKATNMKLHETTAAQRGTIDVLEDEVADLKVQRDKARLDKVCAPTMPVIPKAVAIAIFREGVQHGVEAACSEIDNTNDIEIYETGYTGGFEVSFTKYFDLSEHVDTDLMRDKCGDYSEETVIDALVTLCEDKKFECRIHGIESDTNK